MSGDLDDLYLTTRYLPSDAQSKSEQIAHDNFDRQLIAAGWIVRHKSKINLNAGIGVAVREYRADMFGAIGPEGR